MTVIVLLVGMIIGDRHECVVNAPSPTLSESSPGPYEFAGRVPSTPISGLYAHACAAIAEIDTAAELQEFIDACEDPENILAHAHHDNLVAITAAIRRHENPNNVFSDRYGKILYYGITSKNCPDTYGDQAGHAAYSVQRNWDRYLKGECRDLQGKGCKHKPGDSRDMYGFIAFMAHEYCPENADNDPKGLNKHWIKGVSSFYEDMVYPPLGR